MSSKRTEAPALTREQVLAVLERMLAEQQRPDPLEQRKNIARLHARIGFDPDLAVLLADLDAADALITTLTAERDAAQARNAVLRILYERAYLAVRENVWQVYLQAGEIDPTVCAQELVNASFIPLESALRSTPADALERVRQRDFLLTEMGLFLASLAGDIPTWEAMPDSFKAILEDLQRRRAALEEGGKNDVRS